MNEAESQEKSSKFSDIGEILGILRKRRGVIIWTTIICAVLTFFTSVFVISPKYSSNTDILVNQKANNNNDQNANQGQIQTAVQMINTYKDIITFFLDNSRRKSICSKLFFNQLEKSLS